MKDRKYLTAMIITLLIGLIICILIILTQNHTIADLRYSRDLWQNHAMRMSEQRMKNYQSDYSYLTTGRQHKVQNNDDL